MEITEFLPHLSRLHFPPAQEQAFHADYFKKSITTTRLALLLGIVMVALFGLLDLWAAPAALHIIWRIRFLVICPIFAVVLLLTYHPFFMRWMQPLVSLAVIGGGVGIAAMSAVTMPNEPAYTSYYVGLLLVIMWGYTFIRLRFWYATVSGLIIVTGYEVVAIAYQNLLASPMGQVTFINNNFFFVAANILGMFAAYFIERYARLDFAQRQAIAAEKAKSEHLLQQEAETALRAIVEGTASATGTDFFKSLTQYLATALDVRHAFIAEVTGDPPERVRTLAFWSNGGPVSNLEYALSGTPCENVVAGSVCYYPHHVQATFPTDLDLVKLSAESYLGMPLPDSTGKVLGHVAVLDNEPMRDEARRKDILKIFAARAGAELERQRAEEKLRQSEEHFRSLIENTSDGITVIDPNGIFTYVSPSYERILGWRAEELLGQSFASLIHPEDLPLAGQSIGQITQNPGQTSSAEVRARHKDGSWRVIEGKGKLLPNGSLVSNIRDVTQRRQLEDDLRCLNEELEDRVAERTAQLEASFAERTRLATIIEAMPDYVGIADLKGWSLYVNQAGRAMVGKPEKDEAPWNVANCYPAEEMPRLQGMFEAMQQGESWSGESRLRRLNGDTLPVEQTVFPLRDPSGRIESYAAVIRDISERKQAEAALHQAKEAAEAASRAKSTFLANMSHEIRTPMNAVIGMTGLLLNTSLNDKQRDFVETIRTAGDSLLTIINDILDLSKIEAERLELESQPFDLRACIESALDLVAPRAAEQGLDLAYVMDSSVPAGIIGDVTRLRQILVNLLSNAIKFTPKGEVVVSVSSLRSQDLPSEANVAGDADLRDTLDELHFSVRDTGIGIAPDQIERLFHIFSQLDPSTTRQYGGTGLGLAISRRLSELMGGRMWAESEGPGCGATFHFTLTARSAPVPVRRHLQNPRAELAGKRVLIVDDNPTNRHILRLQIESWGMQPVEAATPAETIALICQGDPFDLALLDMHLPEMDGLALAGKIRERCSISELPLVMLTSVGGSEINSQVEAAAGVAACLTKPVKPSQLYDVLVGVFAAQPGPSADRPRGQNGAGEAQELAEAHLAKRIPLRMLVVEDVAVNQKFALLALEEMGYRAEVAGNGLEALSAVTRQPYDVVLMDVQMPEMDGLEATRRIHQLWENGDRAGLPTPHRPYIVAMTANALQGDREICLEAGMDDYVSKPIYLSELRAALERAGQTRSRRTNGASPAQGATAEIGGTLPVDPVTLAKTLKRRQGLETINLYLTEARATLEALQMAVVQQDARAALELAHSLKGSSRYLGAGGVATLSESLEQLGRRGALAGAPALLDQLLAEFERVQQQLERSKSYSEKEIHRDHSVS